MKELNPNINTRQNPEILHESCDPVLETCASAQDFKIEHEQLKNEEQEHEEEELRRLLLPNVEELPDIPPLLWKPIFQLFLLLPGHDQYVHRHANGLCVIGLAPTHVAFKDKGGITSVDFNVGKSDRSGIKVTGKRKKVVNNTRLNGTNEEIEYSILGLVAVGSGLGRINPGKTCVDPENAQLFESNTALCKVCTGDSSYIVRCCVKGSLLEVNDRLIKQPELLNTMPEREGYIAIMMPKPADWLKAKASLLSLEEYKKLRTEL
ncbi:UNVERIFIED_CONTAM: protein Abitram [Sesamum radiatum]|uniref:Protein Abitram n=1 Tax=Sesamum radiatum TaxID=300843 RepID=A0AAW2M694_SESRA